MTKLIDADLTYEVRGALYIIHNELGYSGLSEAGWQKALILILEERGIPAQSQVEYELRYQEYRIGRFFIDILVDNKLLLELKSKEKLQPIDEAQVITYFKVTGLKLGLLVNFGGDKLEIKRIPNFISNRTAQSEPSHLVSTPEGWLYPALTGELRALLYEIHRELGPGFMHMHYRRAAQIGLRRREIPYQVKKEITIEFRQQPIETRETRLLIVDDKVLLAPIAVRNITPAIKRRFRYYLRLLGLKMGLIANFHAPSLEIETIRV